MIIENDYFKFIGDIQTNNIKDKKCYGSIIKSKKNCFYLKLYYNEIKSMLYRRYYDEDKGIELYVKRNKSYYFIFDDNNERNILFNKIKQYLKYEIYITKSSTEKNKLTKNIIPI